MSLLATSLLPLAGKRALLELLVRLPRLDARGAHGQSLGAWLAREVPEPHARALLALLFRVSCYTAETEAFDAGWALAQLQRALAGNVLYLDAGGVVRAAHVPVVGRARRVLLLRRLWAIRGEPRVWRLTRFNGAPALYAEFAPGPPGWPTRSVLQLGLAPDGRVREVRIVLAPRKLAHLGAATDAA